MPTPVLPQPCPSIDVTFVVAASEKCEMQFIFDFISSLNFITVVAFVQEFLCETPSKRKTNLRVKMLRFVPCFVALEDQEEKRHRTAANLFKRVELCCQMGQWITHHHQPLL